MQQVQPEAAAGDNAAAAIEIRLEEIERKLDELATAGRKSDTPPPPNKERSGFWSEILKALIPSLVLMWATYAIKDSVDMALQERQVNTY